MNRVRRAVTVTTLAALLVAAAPAAAGSLERAQPQPPQEQFVPLAEAPPGDQLPAAPLLIAAYALVWLIVFGYLWSIWRRQTAVERDLGELSRRAGGDGRGA